MKVICDLKLKLNSWNRSPKINCSSPKVLKQENNCSPLFRWSEPSTNLQCFASKYIILIITYHTFDPQLRSAAFLVRILLKCIRWSEEQPVIYLLEFLNNTKKKEPSYTPNLYQGYIFEHGWTLTTKSWWWKWSRRLLYSR